MPPDTPEEPTLEQVDTLAPEKVLDEILKNVSPIIIELEKRAKAGAPLKLKQAEVKALFNFIVLGEEIKGTLTQEVNLLQAALQAEKQTKKSRIPILGRK